MKRLAQAVPAQLNLTIAFNVLVTISVVVLLQWQMAQGALATQIPVMAQFIVAASALVIIMPAVIFAELMTAKLVSTTAAKLRRTQSVA